MTDEEELDITTERDFLICFFKFIYDMSGKRMVDHLQLLIKRSQNHADCPFTPNILKAIVVQIQEEADSSKDTDFSQFKEELETLQRSFSPQTFLKFLSRFARNYLTNNKKVQVISPEEFYDFVLSFLKSKRELTGEFWENLHKTADDVAGLYSNYPYMNYLIDNEVSPGKQFLLNLMSLVFNESSKDLPYYLAINIELAKLFRLVSYFTPIVAEAVCLIYDEEQALRSKRFKGVSKLNDLTDSLKGLKYLKYCVACSIEAILRYNDEDNTWAPLKYFYKLWKTLMDRFEGKHTDAHKFLANLHTIAEAIVYSHYPRRKLGENTAERRYIAM